MNDVVYIYDCIFQRWVADYSQEVPEPNWVFQSQVAHVGEVVQYLVEQYQYEQNKVVEHDGYEGVEFV